MFCSIFGDYKDEQNFGLLPAIDRFGLSSQLSRGSVHPWEGIFMSTSDFDTFELIFDSEQ